MCRFKVCLFKAISNPSSSAVVQEHAHRIVNSCTNYRISMSTFRTGHYFFRLGVRRLNEGSNFCMEIQCLDPDLAEGSEPFICAICSHIVRKPLAIECSHLFCEECLRKWVNSTENPKCPSCKASVDISRAVPNNFVWKMIENLKFQCPNAKSGCTFIDIGGVELRNLKAHVGQCGFQLIPCSLCNDKVAKKDMNDHVSNYCVERNVKCKICDAVTKFRLLSAHDKDCQEMEVSCELCEVKVKRKALPRHYEQSMVQHFRTMQNQIRDLKQQLQCTTQELQNTTQQLHKATHTLEAVVMECGLGDGVYQQCSTQSKEEFTWYCKDYVQGGLKLDFNSQVLTMKAGYRFYINVQIFDQQFGVYLCLEPSDDVTWPFAIPYTVQTLKPTLSSVEVDAAVLTNPEYVTSFGASPTIGCGSAKLAVADLGDDPLLVRIIFHLDRKLASQKQGEKKCQRKRSSAVKDKKTRNTKRNDED